MSQSQQFHAQSEIILSSIATYAWAIFIILFRRDDVDNNMYAAHLFYEITTSPGQQKSKALYWQIETKQRNEVKTSNCIHGLNWINYMR